jgi:hypothetical protein
MANKTEHFMTVDNGRLQPGLAGKMMRSSKTNGWSVSIECWKQQD